MNIIAAFDPLQAASKAGVQSTDVMANADNAHQQKNLPAGPPSFQQVAPYIGFGVVVLLLIAILVVLMKRKAPANG